MSADRDDVLVLADGLERLRVMSASLTAVLGDMAQLADPQSQFTVGWAAGTTMRSLAAMDQHLQRLYPDAFPDALMAGVLAAVDTLEGRDPHTYLTDLIGAVDTFAALYEGLHVRVLGRPAP